MRRFILIIKRVSMVTQLLQWLSKLERETNGRLNFSISSVSDLLQRLKLRRLKSQQSTVLWRFYSFCVNSAASSQGADIQMFTLNTTPPSAPVSARSAVAHGDIYGRLNVHEQVCRALVSRR